MRAPSVDGWFIKKTIMGKNIYIEFCIFLIKIGKERKLIYNNDGLN